MTPGRATLALIFVFLAGGVLGVLAAAGWVHHRLGALHQAEPAELEELVVDVLDHHLELTPEQRLEVEGIVGEAHGELAAFHEEHREELGAILHRVAARVTELLGDDQQIEWVEIHERMLDHLVILRGWGVEGGGLGNHGAAFLHGAGRDDEGALPPHR